MELSSPSTTKTSLSSSLCHVSIPARPFFMKSFGLRKEIGNELCSYRMPENICALFIIACHISKKACSITDKYPFYRAVCPCIRTVFEFKCREHSEDVELNILRAKFVDSTVGWFAVHIYIDQNGK